MKKNIKNKINSNGFTLIEVLVALIILAIGILGIAGLQFQALRFNHDAYLRTQINVAATDVMELMRINSNPDAFVGNHTVGDAIGACDLSVANDSANDLACWHQQLEDVLPVGSQANITSAATGDGTQYTVTLTFTPREDGAATKNISFTFQPN